MHAPRLWAPQASACAVLLSLPLWSSATLPDEETAIVGSARISYVRAGTSPATAVFQAGLGDGKRVWAPVIDRVSPSTAVFAYDRPGYGASSAAPGSPRDPCAIARELNDLLRVAGVQPPYVLVGHSLGGLYQYAFALLYPGEVSALLLLDPTHPDHWATMERRVPARAAVVIGLRNTVFTGAMRAEFDDQTGCLDALRARPAPSIPVRILVRSRFDRTESGGFESMVRDLEVRWLALLPGATRRQVDGAGHYVQRDEPGVVADELRVLAQGARAGKP